MTVFFSSDSFASAAPTLIESVVMLPLILVVVVPSTISLPAFPSAVV